jgi:hypothetical protein
MEALSNLIKMNGVPKSFRDAIAVARAVKVRFLWIDSLCIVQDDEEDKARELGRMHLIYSMTICLIAASAAQDGQAGCFIPRTGTSANKPISEVKINLKNKKQQLAVSIYPYLSDFYDAVNNGPLATRAWTFQERQLSKRNIHFTERRLVWECRSAIALEDCPQMS